jgi:hypothetical protein
VSLFNSAAISLSNSRLVFERYLDEAASSMNDHIERIEQNRLCGYALMLELIE